LPLFEKLDKCNYATNMQSYEAFLKSFFVEGGKLIFSLNTFREIRYGFNPSNFKKIGTMDLNAATAII